MINNQLVLVNEYNSISKDFIPKDLIIPFDNFPEHRLEKEASNKLLELIKYIEGENLIIPVSGYRSYNEQKLIYIKSLLKNGLNYTKKYVAREGNSEHQTGLAIDLGLNSVDNDFISPSFKDHPIVDKFLKYMADFGFILRYPKDKTAITGIAYEPWHFRYVGKEHSQIIDKRNWSLEEYIFFLEDRYGRLSI